MRRKRKRTDPRTGEVAKRRTKLEPNTCRCGFPQKMRKGLLVWCGGCRTGHDSV